MPPQVYLPDQESTEEALLRQRAHFIQEASANYMDQAYRDEKVAKANKCLAGLVEFFPEKYEIKP